MKQLTEYEQVALFEALPFVLAWAGVSLNGPHHSTQKRKDFQEEKARLMEALNEAHKNLPKRNPFLPEGEPARWDYEVREKTGERWLPCRTIHHAKNNARFSKNATGRIRPVYEVCGSPEEVPPLGQSNEVSDE